MCIEGRSPTRRSTASRARFAAAGSCRPRGWRCGSGLTSSWAVRPSLRSRGRPAGASSSRRSSGPATARISPIRPRRRRGGGASGGRRPTAPTVICQLRLLCAGELPESWIPPAHILELRTRVRMRKTLIDQRTAWQQRLQAQLFHQGVPAGLRPRTRAGREALAQAELSPAGRELVALALRTIDMIDRELVALDRALRSFARRQPACRALIANLYGVGAISATAILAELGDCRRFASSDAAVRHSGLDVTVYQSDSKRSAGHLSHEGPELLRWALFEAAHQSARHSSPDHDYYLQVAARIDHNRACLSFARKLCRLAHHLLRELGDQALAPVEPEPQGEEAIQAAA